MAHQDATSIRDATSNRDATVRERAPRTTPAFRNATARERALFLGHSQCPLPDGRVSDYWSLLRRFLDDANFVFGQPVEIINQVADLPIRRVDLPLYGRLVRRPPEATEIESH